jgi:hypothetical protein
MPITAVMRTGPEVVSLLTAIFNRLEYLQSRIDEVEIDLQHGFEAALARKRDRREKLPIHLIVNGLDPPTTALLKQLHSATAIHETRISQLQVALGDLATKQQPLPPNWETRMKYWRNWVECLLDVRDQTYSQEARIQRLERAAAPRPDGG